MAQSKSFFGLRKGSTKTLTFSVYNGKQVTKDRVYNVKNPRSSMQMMQRAIMATALHGYSALKDICDHSFEGLTYGQPSMNYFISKNANMIRKAAPNVNLSSFKGNSVPNKYIISEGTIPSVDAVYNAGKSGFVINVDGTFADSTSIATLGEVLNGLGATNIGDYITFVFLCGNRNSNASVYWLRLHRTSDSELVNIDYNTDVISSLYSEEGAFQTNIDNFSVGDFVLKFDVAASKGTIIAQVPGFESSPKSFGVIVSRKNDTGWLRSTAIMAMSSDAYNYSEALASYPKNGEKILNGGNM